MKRRQAIGVLAGLPALTALPRTKTAAQVITENPKPETTVPEGIADPLPRFFTSAEFAALRALAALLMPGSLDAGVPEFLDFLIGASPAERQALYREGLQRLDAGSMPRYGKPFAALTASEADPLLAPLREPWTYLGPSDPFARFLAAAREDVMTATLNSREFGTGRTGIYWYRLE